MRRRLLVAGMLVFLAACGAGGVGVDQPTTTGPPASSPQTEPGPTTTPPSTQPPVTRPEPPATTIPPEEPPVTGEVPADLLDAILTDAAERLAVPPADIDVVRGEAVVWNDGSLGCPQPGQAYTQALVPGYHVLVSDGSTELDYRAAETGFFFVCEPRLP